MHDSNGVLKDPSSCILDNLYANKCHTKLRKKKDTAELCKETNKKANKHFKTPLYAHGLPKPDHALRAPGLPNSHHTTFMGKKNEINKDQKPYKDSHAKHV